MSNHPAFCDDRTWLTRFVLAHGPADFMGNDCQNLALIFETVQDEAGALSRPHQLDCDFLSILVICPKGAIDLAPPANPDPMDELIRPEPPPDPILGEAL